MNNEPITISKDGGSGDGSFTLAAPSTNNSTDSRVWTIRVTNADGRYETITFTQLGKPAPQYESSLDGKENIIWTVPNPADSGSLVVTTPYGLQLERVTTVGNSEFVSNNLTDNTIPVGENTTVTFSWGQNNTNAMRTNVYRFKDLDNNAYLKNENGDDFLFIVNLTVGDVEHTVYTTFPGSVYVMGEDGTSYTYVGELGTASPAVGDYTYSCSFNTADYQTIDEPNSGYLLLCFGEKTDPNNPTEWSGPAATIKTTPDKTTSMGDVYNSDYSSRFLDYRFVEDDQYAYNTITSAEQVVDMCFVSNATDLYGTIVPPRFVTSYNGATTYVSAPKRQYAVLSNYYTVTFDSDVNWIYLAEGSTTQHGGYESTEYEAVPTSGNFGNRFKVKFAQNTTGSARTGVITFTATYDSKTIVSKIKVKQLSSSNNGYSVSFTKRASAEGGNTYNRGTVSFIPTGIVDSVLTIYYAIERDYKEYSNDSYVESTDVFTISNNVDSEFHVRYSGSSSEISRTALPQYSKEIDGLGSTNTSNKYTCAVFKLNSVAGSNIEFTGASVIHSKIITVCYALGSSVAFSNTVNSDNYQHVTVTWINESDATQSVLKSSENIARFKSNVSGLSVKGSGVQNDYDNFEFKLSENGGISSSGKETGTGGTITTTKSGSNYNVQYTPFFYKPKSGWGGIGGANFLASTGPNIIIKAESAID